MGSFKFHNQFQASLMGHVIHVCFVVQDVDSAVREIEPTLLPEEDRRADARSIAAHIEFRLVF